ncbi:triose-phosphate isomerase [Aliidiomarina sp. Khilg15.8]
MRQSLVIANWKQNGSLALVDTMVQALAKDEFQAKVAICPPAVYLAALQARCAGTSIALGAQTSSQFDDGAYTGEIAAQMLNELGCEYVLVGHSERRALFHENNDVVAAKLQAAQKAKLTPVLCVGESLQQREAGETMQVVEEQLVTALKGADLSQLVVAYEPVWAIGTGKTATPEQAQDVHAQIRELLTQHDAAHAQTVPLLYGGSVKAENAEVLFAQTEIDGGLIGGASLKADQFRAICSAVKG